MAGLMITPQTEDFERITFDVARNILREVTLPDAIISGVVEKIKQSLQG